jgi:hypothetical protein
VQCSLRHILNLFLSREEEEEEEEEGRRQGQKQAETDRDRNRQRQTGERWTDGQRQRERNLAMLCHRYR